MSERLTDEELDAIDAQCDGMGLVSLNAQAQRDVRAMTAELRSLRAAALTAEDREALAFARAALMDDAARSEETFTRFETRYAAAFAVLDRLLASKERG